MAKGRYTVRPLRTRYTASHGVPTGVAEERVLGPCSITTAVPAPARPAISAGDRGRYTLGPLSPLSKVAAVLSCSMNELAVSFCIDPNANDISLILEIDARARSTGIIRTYAQNFLAGTSHQDPYTGSAGP
jgi:hypothetical protein